MDKNVLLALFLLFLTVADVSNAKIRGLATADPKADSDATPGSGTNKPDSTPVEAGNKKKPEAHDTPSQLDKQQLNKTDSASPLQRNQTTDNSKSRTSNTTDSVNLPAQNQTADNPKVFNITDSGKNLTSSNDTGLTTGSVDKGKNTKNSNNTELVNSPVKENDNRKKDGKKDGTKEKNNEDKRGPELGVNETCMGLPNRCRDDGKLIACIQSFDTGSREWTVLVQNEGDKTLRVNLTVPTAVENPLKQLELSKNSTEKINILSIFGKNNKLIFKAGNGECVLHMDPLESQEKFFLYLPSYDKLLTPINGAYFLILSVLILGGTWACCKFRKRRWREGAPYQELEMGLPESVSATHVETAEGWDQGWDDDWDDDNAIKSLGGTHMGSISANGLTSRSPNKDGWEHDWDD